MLKVENYTAGYINNLFLFHEISFELKPHEIIGVRGTNGCGKSTFIKGIIGLTPIKKGNIYLNEVSISNWDTSKIIQTKEIGYLSQRERIFPNLTVEENIQIYRYHAKKKKIIENETTKEIILLLSTKMKTLAANLSGGEQLLLALYCLDIQDPTIFLLDEPSDSLDNNFKFILINLLHSWREMGKSILIVEHNVEILKETSNHILILQ